MSGASFRLRIVTPAEILERDITHIRLMDATGYFGILKGHIDLVTVLVPSLGYYRDAEGRETFLAVGGGILSVRNGEVTLTTRQLFAGDSAERLAALIDDAAAKRQKSERALVAMLEQIERSFIEKAAGVLK